MVGENPAALQPATRSYSVSTVSLPSSPKFELARRGGVRGCSSDGARRPAPVWAGQSAAQPGMSGCLKLAGSLFPDPASGEKGRGGDREGKEEGRRAAGGRGG